MFEAKAMLIFRDLECLLNFSLTIMICLSLLFDFVFCVNENSFTVEGEISIDAQMLSDDFRLDFTQELLHSLSDRLCTPLKLFFEVLRN